MNSECHIILIILKTIVSLLSREYKQHYITPLFSTFCGFASVHDPSYVILQVLPDAVHTGIPTLSQVKAIGHELVCMLHSVPQIDPLSRLESLQHGS